jgi:hypothetical protein
MKLLITSLIGLGLLGTSIGRAENYKYRNLITYDYDEMRQQVQNRIKKAKSLANESGEASPSDAEAIETLRDALKLIFSRPDSDNMIAKIVPDIKRPLMGFSAYEDTLSSLVGEAIAVLKNDNTTVMQQSTALFIIENILREIKPEAERNEDYKNIFKKVADAKLDISHEVKLDRKLNAMFDTKNPSDEAKKVLKQWTKNAENAEKAAKEKEKKEAKEKKEKEKASQK